MESEDTETEDTEDINSTSAESDTKEDDIEECADLPRDSISSMESLLTSESYLMLPIKESSSNYLDTHEKTIVECVHADYEEKYPECVAAINEKDNLLAAQKIEVDGYRNSVSVMRICAKRNDDDFIKTKSRRKTGSSKNIQKNTCEYPDCGKVDVDLVMCSICARYVCEECNDVPISKLKAIVKVCKTVHFFCKECSSDEGNGHESTAKIEEDNKNKNEVIKRQHEELVNKKNIIESMERAEKTLINLADDRKEVIENQKIIIENLQNDSELYETKEDLKDARKIIALKEDELTNCLVKLQTMEETGSGMQPNDKEELMTQIQVVKQANIALSKKLYDQDIIIKKNEVTYDVQEKLVLSKCEIIENLKTIISQSKKLSSCLGSERQENNLTSDISTERLANIQRKKHEDLENLSEKCKIPGFQEGVLCLSLIALYGLVVNGPLLWVDIQRRTSTANEWKEKAMKHFTGEEIATAKNLLWDVCDEAIIGEIVNRQGSSKQQSEINDIENALNALADKKVVPLFVATSNMVMQTPHQEPANSQPTLKVIEPTTVKVKYEELKVQFDDAKKTISSNKKEINGYIKKLAEAIKEKERFEQEGKGRKDRLDDVMEVNLALEKEIQNKVFSDRMKDNRGDGDKENIGDRNKDHRNTDESRVCRYFSKMGKCRNGVNCIFEHKQICRFYYEGRCNKTHCDFVHTKKDICHANAKKMECKYGEKCRFIHIYNVKPNIRWEDGKELMKNIENSSGKSTQIMKSRQEYNQRYQENHENMSIKENQRISFLEVEIKEIKTLLKNISIGQNTPNQDYQQFAENQLFTENQFYPLMQYNQG